jgi:hypothetical protein
LLSSKDAESSRFLPTAIETIGVVIVHGDAPSGDDHALQGRAPLSSAEVSSTGVVGVPLSARVRSARHTRAR